MKWMEWIKVQTATLPETTRDDIHGLIRELTGIPGLAAINFFRNAVTTSEVAILLLWEIEPPHPQGSMVGVQLAAELRNIGWVAHSVWISR